MAAGVGGSIEWSLLRMRANSVMGMWQAMHLFPGLSALWCVCSVGLLTLSLWQGMHAWLALSSALNLYRPLEVWQCRQSSLPDLTQGLISQEV